MSSKIPFVRLNSHVEPEVVDSLKAIAAEENVPYAEVVREVIRAGLLARQDRKTHQTRLYTLVESLEAQVKTLEQRVSVLEAGRQ